VKDDRDFYMVLGICVLLVMTDRLQARHLKLHDEMLGKILHADLDAELAAMSPPREA
jgi:hypothetical protein